MKFYISIILISICAFAASAQLQNGAPNTAEVKTDVATTEKGNSFVLWKPECKMCDYVTTDGMMYRIFNADGFTLAFQMENDGDYYVANVYLVNNSEQRIDFDPTQSSMAIWTESDLKKNTNPTIYFAIPAEKIAAKMERRAAWGNFFTALSGAMATRETDVRTTGKVRVTDNSGNSANGTYNSTATVTTSDTEAQRRADNKIAANNERTTAITRMYLNNNLKANTIFQNQKIGGNIYFPKKKFAELMLGIKVKNITYIILYVQPKKK